MIAQQQDDERRKQRALERLGTQHPVCVLCGEDDYRCLELHHVAGQAYDQITGILCRNCHRKLSDPSQNRCAPDDPPLMERIGHLLLGLAQYLLALAERLTQTGQELLHGVALCPPPYGRAKSLGSEA